jgi:hypothetical protein
MPPWRNPPITKPKPATVPEPTPPYAHTELGGRTDYPVRWCTKCDEPCDPIILPCRGCRGRSTVPVPELTAAGEARR